eukprot:668317-Prorocentrum_minimum.AAC.1
MCGALCTVRSILPVQVPSAAEAIVVGRGGGVPPLSVSPTSRLASTAAGSAIPGIARSTTARGHSTVRQYSPHSSTAAGSAIPGIA